ncbi:urease accessory protein UreF [Pseudomonadota bacterium]
MQNNQNAMLQLCRLVSPALPIGAYAYSQGLESACEYSWVHDQDSALHWINGALEHSVSCLDLPLLLQLYSAWQNNCSEDTKLFSQRLLANRETSELRDEDRHLGQALARLLNNLNINEADYWRTSKECCYANMFALAAVKWNIDRADSLAAYAWSWSENQVAAAIKLIPLGQTAGQAILSQLIELIPAYVRRAQLLNDNEIGGSLPGLAIASANHEIQYSRLFRS